VAPESVIVEATGTESEIDALVALLRSYGIKELVRTGAVVMLRGAGSIEETLKP
jgi:acetolactate synthase-1/3 small subunit